MHDLIAYKGMKSIRSNKIDGNIESVGEEVFELHERHHADWLVKFHNEIEIACFSLVFPGI